MARVPLTHLASRRERCLASRLVCSAASSKVPRQALHGRALCLGEKRSQHHRASARRLALSCCPPASRWWCIHRQVTSSGRRGDPADAAVAEKASSWCGRTGMEGARSPAPPPTSCAYPHTAVRTYSFRSPCLWPPCHCTLSHSRRARRSLAAHAAHLPLPQAPGAWRARRSVLITRKAHLPGALQVRHSFL